MGAMGGGLPLCPAPGPGVRGMHSGEARTSDQHQIVQQWALGQPPGSCISESTRLDYWPDYWLDYWLDYW